MKRLSLIALLLLCGCQPVFRALETMPPVPLGSQREDPSNEAQMPPELFDSGVSRKTSDLMASMFSEASARLRAIVLNPPGYTTRSREFQAAFAAQRVQQIDGVMSQLKARASGWVGANLPRAAKDGIKLAHKQADEAGVRPKGGVVAGSFALIDARTVEALARDTVGDLYKAADSMERRAKSVLRQTAQLGLDESAINKILAGGVIEGTPRNTLATLRRELEAVHGDAVEINGRNYDTAYYAEMVARTKTREATVVARHQRLESLGLDLVAIVGRVSNNFCSAFLGQVFSLSGKSDKYPAFAELPGGGPPFHPNCSKSTRPFVEELASEAQMDAAEILPDAKLLLGTDPSAAQRAFKDLQLHAQIKDRYATTAAKLFG